MQASERLSARRTLRFDAFEVDLRTREVRKHGVRLKLHGMPAEILTILVERPGELVTREELRQRFWPDGTFVDFDNSLNSSINRLREALGDSAENPRYVETLPRRGYRFLGSVEEVSPAAPAEGTALGAGVAQPAPTRARRLGALVLAAAIGAAYLGWHQLRPPANVRAGRVMLAVIPFENLSGDPQQEYMSDGFTEEMITQLARLHPGQLGVIARTTSMKFKGTQKGVDQVGRELGVDYILEGSVRRASDKVRITAQLVRVSDQTHLWAESYDRELRDLLALHTDVGQSVARQIQILVAPSSGPQGPGARPANPQAYEAYLRARYHHSQATVQALENAIQFYNQAIETDPNFALAYAGLARAYIFGVRIRPKAALEKAHLAAKKALELDPSLPEAQLAVAMSKLYSQWDWAGAEADFQRALGLDPGNADTHFYFSHYLAATGRLPEGVAAARRAQELDPFSPLIGHYVGRHFYMARDYTKALEELHRTLELNPNYPWTHVFLFLTYEKLGQYDQAVEHRQKYLGLIGRSPEEVNELGRVYKASGYPAVLEKWTHVVMDYFRRNGHLTSADIVHVYASLGRADEAFRWLEQVFADHTRDLIYLHVEPGYDPLRSDPRFQVMLRRAGFPPAAAPR